MHSRKSMAVLLILAFCLKVTALAQEATPDVATEQPASAVTVIQPVSYKSPLGAAALALLVPGLGHVYLNDWPTAAGLFGGSVGFFALAEYRKSQYSLNTWFGPIIDPRLANDPWYRLAQTYQQNIYFYNIYAAYRDARTHNQDL